MTWQILGWSAATFLRVSPQLQRFPTLKINSLLALKFNGELYGRANNNLKIEYRYNHIWMHKQFAYIHMGCHLYKVEKLSSCSLYGTEPGIHTTFGNLHVFEYYRVCFSASFIYALILLSFPSLSTTLISCVSNQSVPS